MLHATKALKKSVTDAEKILLLQLKSVASFSYDIVGFFQKHEAFIFWKKMLSYDIGNVFTSDMLQLRLLKELNSLTQY